MSTKFEQLLDYLVNEEMDKANELFHEIVVEKSRDIYENLIAEEEQEEMDEAADEEAEESVEEAEEDQEESVEEGADESMELEDSYSMEGDDEEAEMPAQDQTDDFGSDIEATDDEEGGEESEEAAIFDFKDAFEQLEDAFRKLEAAQSAEQGEEPAEFDADPSMDNDDEMMGHPAMESRRVTREYVEKVGNDWDKSGSQKAQGKNIGSGSGDTDSAPSEGKSPISSGKGKPTTGATAANIAQKADEGGTPTGTTPAGKAGGFLSNPKDMNTGNGNVPGGKMGVKNLSKVAGGHGAEKKGAAPGPVGAGTGDKAGQTSDAAGSKKQFLPANK